MEKNMQIIDLSDATKVLTWNKWLLSFVGIWPLKIHDVIFIATLLYMAIYSLLMFADLFDVPKSLDDILANTAENTIFVMTIGKIAYCRYKRRSLARLLTDIEEDFISEKYEKAADRLIFWNYNRMSCKYIVTVVSTMTISLIGYFTTNLITCLKIVRDNSSVNIHLPSRARVFFVDLHDKRIYYFCSLCQTVSIAIIVTGYVGVDCLFTSLAFHITGQLKILRCSIKSVLENTENFRHNMKILITRHYRVIRLAEGLENDFNIIIFQQLLGTMIIVCISVYNWTVLDMSSSTQGVHLICYIFYGSNTIGTLFIYCYCGECLINESVTFSEDIYHYEWYNISPVDLKLVHICMMRARKPLQLTSGKFCVLSLCTFTDTLKATMGYFSLLRQFM